MAIHSSDLEDKIAELERTFQKLADKPPVPEPEQRVYVYRKPKGASTLCGLLAGSLVLWTGWSQIQFNPSVTYYGNPFGFTGYQSGNDPHTTEGVAAIHKEMQSGTVNVSKSTITGIVDSASMSASMYWTFSLKNNNSTDKEASMIIELPKNAALSRATLWINGKAQEASFSSNAQVKNAYDYIAVRHRDPLLVTQVGPNTIKVLAAPVTANGGEMQFRLGITTPLESNSEGQRYVSLPHIKESNLQFDSKQDIHLTSESRLAGIGDTERSGIYVLKANIPQSEMEKAQIRVPHANNASFATRLTHTSPTEYVKVSLSDGELNLERLSEKPNCKFINDDDTAFRVSNLWAHQEIERLAAAGKVNDACDLANVFRVVSTVSGATVLEQQSDYDVNGLNRDMYRVIKGKSSTGNDFMGVHGFIAYSAKTGKSEYQATQASAAAPTLWAGPNATVGPAAPMLLGAVNGAIGAGGDANAFDSGAPMLQGATNGTIGPQGSDATVIMGVNTAGTVRVNNFANIENLFKLLGLMMQVCGFALWAFLMSEAVLNRGMQVPLRLSRAHTFILGFAVGFAALLAPACLQEIAIWLRDALCL